MRDTKIVKSFNSVCDSIAFGFISNLTDWLPAMNNGKFEDQEFTFPVFFRRETPKNVKKKRSGLFSATEKEYKKREKYFDFYHSTDDVYVINDFEFFTLYLANSISDEYVFVYEYEYIFPWKKNSVVAKFSNKSSNTKLILIDKNKKHAILTIMESFNKVRLEKNKSYLLIAYEDNGSESPNLSFIDIDTDIDKKITLDYKQYTRGELLMELKGHDL
jgi:hypothetical protein